MHLCLRIVHSAKQDSQQYCTTIFAMFSRLVSLVQIEVELCRSKSWAPSGSRSCTSGRLPIEGSRQGKGDEIAPSVSRSIEDDERRKRSCRIFLYDMRLTDRLVILVDRDVGTRVLLAVHNRLDSSQTRFNRSDRIFSALHSVSVYPCCYRLVMMSCPTSRAPKYVDALKPCAGRRDVRSSACFRKGALLV